MVQAREGYVLALALSAVKKGGLTIPESVLIRIGEA